MNNYRWIVALALSLILGLGSVATSAHNHIDDHIDGSINGNSSHQEGSCSICFQESTVIVNPDTSATILVVPTVAKAVFSTAKPAEKFSLYLSRAPPSNA
jgi:hypothetical protein